MVTKICDVEHKIGYNLACARDTSQVFAHSLGVFRVDQFNGVTQNFAQTTLVAMVTKISKFQQ